MDFLEACPGHQSLMHDFEWFYLGSSNKPKGMDERWDSRDLEETSEDKRAA